MPGKKKKQFIDKKNAVTFHLVHRSQRDPLQADDDAPQRVLLPTPVTKQSVNREKQREYGVFFEDDYDYMQHLRDADELRNVEPVESFRMSAIAEEGPESTSTVKPGLTLPSTVFGSLVQTNVGMLNKAAPVSGPRLDWDPDIVAGLDEDFNYDDPDNQLDDNFMDMANEEMEEGQECDNQGSLERCSADEDPADTFRPVKPVNFHSKADDDDVASDEAAFSDDDFDDSDDDRRGPMDFDEVETKSRFTEYSMTSSVTTRNDGLSLLDDRFEKFYEQYDEDEIGALDNQDIGGVIKSDNLILTQAMEEFEKQQKIQTLKDTVEKGREFVEMVEDDDDDDDVEMDLVNMVVEPPKEKWDCESILSTYSTLYNHPTLISEPKKGKSLKLTKRAGIPADVLPTRGLTRKQLEEASTIDKSDCANTYRPKNETADERKERKQAIKEERKTRREQKKSTKIAFKNEKVRQEKEQLNIRHNQQGLALT